MNGRSTDTVEGTSSDSQATPSRREDLVLRELDGEALLYDARSGAVHWFNDTALFVWHRCDGRQTVEHIAEQLSGDLAVEPARACPYVLGLVAAMAQRSLLADRSKLCAETQPLEPVSIPSSEPRALARADLELETQQQCLDDRNAENPLDEKPPQRELSRRELLSGGASKLVLSAPVISTFFATGALASGGSGNFSFGCKFPAFSCAIAADCCDVSTASEQCEAGSCCIEPGGNGCTINAECCAAATSGCVAGTCQ